MDRGLVRALRASLLDVVTVAETERRGLDDEQQLTYATSVGRVVYTCNFADFARLHSRWIRSGRHHAGIIVLVDQGTGRGVQIAALARLVLTLDSATMRDRLEFLSNWTDA